MLIGFDEVKSKLLKSYDQNKLSHALLITGKEGVGKASFAKNFALEILGDENINNPDLLIIEKEEGKKEIGVNNVRKIANFINQTSAASQAKFIIIDSACQLNKSSANAILKILEEPHPGNYLILISHNLGKILPTIRSRCNIVKIDNLDRDEFITILQNNNLNFDGDKLDFLIEIFDLSAASAVKNGDEIIELYQEFLNSFKNKLLSEKIISKISNKEFSFTIILRILEFFTSRLLNFSLQKEEKLFFNESEIFLEISNKKSFEEIAKNSEKGFEFCRKTASLNLDKKQSLINFFNLIS